jgi:hypothetical protein
MLVPWWSPDLARSQSLAASPSQAADEREGSGLKVKVSVQASDPNGRRLSFRWRSTDGKIVNVNAPTTTWSLADGPGLHFAYVLVSDDAGGYTERRVAVNTDAIGTRIRSHDPVRYRAPPAPVPSGEVYRSFVRGQAILSNNPHELTEALNIPDVFVFAQDLNQTVRFPATGAVTSTARGEFTISGVQPVAVPDDVNTYCDATPLGSFGSCGFASADSGAAFNVTPNQAVTDYINRSAYVGDPPVNQVTAGTAVLADGTACGTVNEFFGVTVTGTASLLDASNNVIGGPARLSDLGAYSLLYSPSATRVLLQCEGAAPQYVSISGAGDLGTATFPATAQPLVATMTVALKGLSVGLFLPPPAGVPSDAAPSPERFLSYKGIDSRQDACAYYQAIGAAKGCDSSGNLVNPISFDDWMRATKMGKYAPVGAPTEFTANYINRADLNLARNHHSISYGPDRTAAYVCNHLGPSVLDPAQPEIDSVVDTLLTNQKLVACVAMDYTATPGTNEGKPFVRFLIFGPNGALLPSINLDGRREKFVPGTCIVCHGGDHYAGHFLAGNSANVGAHYLPYDTGNFEFSSVPGLTEADQEEAIHSLNQNVLNTGPTVAERELIAGWYQSSHTLDKNYLPASWQGQGPVATSFYQNVLARSCRGCHVAMVEGYNFDHYQNIYGDVNYRGTSAQDLTYVIGCFGANSVFRSHSMPNSLVTFNRFWNSVGTSIDQQAISIAFLGEDFPGQMDVSCRP